MRKIIKKTAGWVHATLIMAIILPLFCALGLEWQDIAGKHLYAKCLLIFFPIVITDYAVEKCRSMLTYLVISILTFAAMGALGSYIARSLYPMGMSIGYAAALSIETIFVIVDRMLKRLRRKEQEEASQEADPYWRPLRDDLREPAFPVLFYFLIIYIVAQNVSSPAVCNEALFSAALYTPVFFAYQYVVETENYLSLNKRTCNLPSKRIYGIGSGILTVFLVLLIGAAAVSGFTADARKYSDIRKWALDRKIDYGELEMENEGGQGGEDPMEELKDFYGEPKPMPRWLTALSYLFMAGVFLFAVYLLLKAIRAQFRIFRETRDENGDIVEELQESEPAQKKARKGHSRRLSERERIRKQYRKTIRHYRKERPAVSESPTEIEIKAGIAGEAQMQALHERYEKARYGELFDVDRPLR
ncbi:MAG: hypothetical protein NC314_01920 [Roseburia sp.]|nr:hypothetical protein [Roseburia sp.]MCM1241573.1 hypothetical protein [Roseburia sp.]